MTSQAESAYPQDWFRIAAADLGRVKRRLAEGDVEDAAFHLQQAIEKGLKGYLLLRGWTLRRIHDVDALLTDAIRYDAGLARYRSLCQQVAGYYMIERYPVFGDEPLIGDVRTAYQEAKTLMQHLQSSRRPQRGLRGG